ncbi:MAG: hypothetical protein HYX51_01270, partial [Chloroflexi bacterium]|nr:hypothetical protein [Chloroflexota bacterium]
MLNAGPHKLKSSLIVEYQRFGAQAPWYTIGRVRKYKPGPWESLVPHSLEVVAWILVSGGGMTDEMLARLESAIEQYRRTAAWTLLEGEERSTVEAFVQAIKKQALVIPAGGGTAVGRLPEGR